MACPRVRKQLMILGETGFRLPFRWPKHGPGVRPYVMVREAISKISLDRRGRKLRASAQLYSQGTFRVKSEA